MEAPGTGPARRLGPPNTGARHCGRCWQFLESLGHDLAPARQAYARMGGAQGSERERTQWPRPSTRWRFRT